MKIEKIFFRGKCAVTGKWAYGYFYRSKGHSIIRSAEGEECIVLKQTVGRYTGVKDVKKIPIFEGDIVIIPASMHNIEIKGLVVFHRGGFCVKSILSGTYWDICRPDIKIINNIHEKSIKL